MDQAEATSGVDPWSDRGDGEEDRRGSDEGWVELEQETVEWEGKTWPVVRTKAPLSEDAHVAAEALAAKLAIAGGLKDHDGKRVERAKRYARWRYRGWLAGEIASL